MLRFLVGSLFLATFFSLPFSGSVASAQDLASFAGCSGTDCSMCNIVDLTNGLIQWLIGFLFVLFAIIIAYAGFGLVTSGGNSHAMDEAKGRFTNAIIGLIIVLAAWLVVDTIMRGLVGRPGAEGQIPGSGEVTGWLFWSEVQCYTQFEPDIRQYTPEIFEPNLNAGDSSIITYNGPPAPSTPPGTGNVAIVNYAIQMMNKGCQYSQEMRNGCSGSPGYTDCSNLVEISYRAAGCSSPGGTTAVQYPRAEAIGDRSSLRPGDALVYRNGDRGHVVICTSTGCGGVIHAKGRNYGIVTGSGSDYLGISNIRVIRASRYCPNSGSSVGPQ
jgi:Type IV secretion system pilin